MMEIVEIHWLKSRSLVVWLFITGIITSLLLGGLFIYELHFYLSIAAWIIWNFRTRATDLKRIIGGSPPERKAWMNLMIVIPLIILSVGTICISFYILVLIAPSMLELANKINLAQTSNDSGLYNVAEFLLVVIIAPVVEEVLFRGVLLNRWSTKWGLSRAMLATSLAFGILHFDLVGAAIFGYVMAVLYIKTGTLAIPIACHILNNAFVVGYGIIVGTFEGQVTDGRPEDFDGLVWIGVGCLLISLPYLLYFIRKNRPTIVLT